jgi:two-component system, NarL family, response regulator LiaR
VAIVDALESIRAGEVVVRTNTEGPPDDVPLAGVDWPGQAVGLSPRESEVLAFITQGLSNQEIAQAIYLSINSVKTYIRTAYRKIGVASRSQAVGWGMQHGFAPVSMRLLEPAGRAGMTEKG